MKRIFTILAMVVALLGITSSPVLAGPPPDAGMPDQSSHDAVSTQFSSWASIPGGVAARPYVTALSVINNGVSTPVITNGTAATELSVPVGRISVSIAPVNLCPPGQTPSTMLCYATPNRIGVTVGYQIQPGQMGYDFNNPSRPLLTPVTADTEFDITLSLNTLGKTLRWTWANGIATYWNTTNLGTDTATLRIRLKPALSPLVLSGSQQVGCTQVPVMACQYTQNTHETLSATFVLSLDETLDPIFTGALFSSTRSYMGSLMTSPGQSPQMTYGVSAPKTWSDGSENVAQMSAVLSDAALLNFYGATADVAGTMEFQTNALNLTRTDGGTQGAITWTRWTVDQQGIDGWLITIPDIRFAIGGDSGGGSGGSGGSGGGSGGGTGGGSGGGSVGGSGAVSSFAASVSPATFKVSQKTKLSLSSRKVGAKTLITLQASAAACAKYTCRLTVKSITSVYDSASKSLGKPTVLRKSKTIRISISTKASSGQRLATLLQAKKAGKWVYVSSGVTKAKT